MEEFKYHAKIKWPSTDINNPASWFSELLSLEDWLNNNIGNHMHLWKYINNSDYLTIGFSKPEHKTFFILAYSDYNND